MSTAVTPDGQPRYLSPAEVCELLPGLTTNTLTVWRHYRKGPDYLKVGRRVFYDRDVFNAWLAGGVTNCSPEVSGLRPGR